MRPLLAAFSLCLMATACTAPDTDVSSAATPDMAHTACSADGIGCTTPVTRADAVTAENRNGLGEAAFRWMLNIW